MSTTNIFHAWLGTDLAMMTLWSAWFGPLLAFILLERMAAHLKTVARNIIGHPHLLLHEYWHDEQVAKQKEEKKRGPSEHDPRDGEKHPWAELEGMCADDHACNTCDPLDPVALERQMQIVIFASCFYLGTICMLTFLIEAHAGAVVMLACWFAPIFTLVWQIPRSILIYALVHRSSHAPRHWLRYACQQHSAAPPTGGAHGHAASAEPDQCGGPQERQTATRRPPHTHTAPTDATHAPTDATHAPTDATHAPTDATHAPTD
eukprot:gene18326-34993_t